MFSLTTFLLWVVVILLVIASLYGLFLLILPALYSLLGDTYDKKPAAEYKPITVLIPAENEGPGAVSVIESLLEQDYPGAITVVLLLNDENDTALPYLQQSLSSFITFDGEEIKNQETVVKNREIEVCFTHAGPKREKLNWYRERITTPFVALIDADHRARIDWLRRSVDVLENEQVSGVQARRSPLALSHIPQIWDSAQNHIGNEALSSLLSRYGGTTFFTGTSCVWRSDIYRQYQFEDCITEDTYLSYQLILNGHRIAALPDTGTKEEVAPGILSYLVRRRRWSHGHTHVFFTYLPRVLTAAIPFRRKAQLFFHGAFYLIPFFVLLMMLCISLHTFVQLTGYYQFLILGVSALLTLGVSYFFRIGTLLTRIRDYLLSWLWIGILCTLSMPFYLSWQRADLYFSLLEFPYAPTLKWVHYFCLPAPLIGLFIASLRLKVLHAGKLFLLAITYPAVLFLDILACTFGLFDLLFGSKTWHRVDRTYTEVDETSLHAINSRKFYRSFGVTVLSLICFIFIVNELGAVRSCGRVDSLFFKPLLFSSSDTIQWEVDLTKSIDDNGMVQVNVNSSFKEALPEDVHITHWLNGKKRQLIKANQGSFAAQASYTIPAGWDPYILTSHLSALRTKCSRTNYTSSTDIQIIDRDILVNGERFLIKGMIPSFSNAATNLSTEQGFGQIKKIGANLIRLYHALPENTLQVAEKNHLLVMDQPTEANWSRRNVSLSYDRRVLLGDFQRNYHIANKSPFKFLPFVGNELELKGHKKKVKYVYELLESIDQQKYNFYGYATYSTYLNYPVPILGINMLDSGNVYWDSALNLLKQYQKPVIATELGGFVASSERTSMDLRIHRLITQWRKLLRHGFAGGVIFESHDNWGQPVASGYNDPLLKEHPDDERGIWDQKNNPKLIHKTVRNLFNDIVLTYQTANDGVQTYYLHNRRDYSLKDIQVVDEAGKLILHIEQLEPGEKQVLSDIPRLPGIGTVFLSYSTHLGLRANSEIVLPMFATLSHPVVINEDFIEQSAGGLFKGVLVRDQKLRFVLPSSWNGVKVHGTLLHNTGGILEMMLPSPVRKVDDFSLRPENGAWSSDIPGNLGTGTYAMRFRIPKLYSNNAFIFLDGLAAGSATVRHGDYEKKLPSARYREVYLPLENLAIERAEEFMYIDFHRENIYYIKKQYHPFGEDIEIIPTQPWVFDPVPLEFVPLTTLKN